MAIQTLMNFKTLDDINALVRTELFEVNHFLKEGLSTTIPLIQTLADHIIKSGGKRLRPLLVLLISKALGCQNKKYISLASIIELIHTATLLHDDVVDGSTIRRARPTANALFGNEASVLCGDFLYSRAFQHLIQLESIEILNILASTTNKIAEGEVLQLLNLKKYELSEKDYFEIIKSKTAILFEAACKVAAILSNDPQFSNAASLYGLNIGFAFQLIDDVLDYNGNTHSMGKKIGNDYKEGKLTLPLIYLFNHSSESQKIQIKNLLENTNEDNFFKLLDLMKSKGAFDYTYQLANDRAKIAGDLINSFPSSNYKEALLWLCHFAVERKN